MPLSAFAYVAQIARMIIARSLRSNLALHAKKDGFHTPCSHAKKPKNVV